MGSRDISPEDLPNPSPHAKISAAKRTVSTLVATLRNFGLFPLDHASTRNMLDGVYKSVLAFVDQFGELSFEIDKTRFLYDDCTIHDSAANNENPAYVMYRDGLRCLKFVKGLREEELTKLFQTFHHYREMPDEPDDDLVSALWHLDLKHITYKATSDELWDVEPVLDFSVFDTSGKGAVASEQKEDVEPTSKKNGSWESLRPREDDEQFKDLSVALVAAEQDLWHLATIEKNILEQDIKDCIEQESREEIIGLMLHILKNENEKEVFEAITNHLKEEFRISLISKEFTSAYYLLNNIRDVQKGHDGCAGEWAESLWDSFYDDLVKPEMLSILIPIWHELTTLKPDSVKNFSNVLRLLPARAGGTFAAMINKLSSPNARSLMIEIIASFALRDVNVLEGLLLLPEEDLGLRLIKVVNNIENEQIVRELLKKVVAHPKAKVREEAQKTLQSLGGF